MFSNQIFFLNHNNLPLKDWQEHHVLIVDVLIITSQYRCSRVLIQSYVTIHDETALDWFTTLCRTFWQWKWMGVMAALTVKYQQKQNCPKPDHSLIFLRWIHTCWRRIRACTHACDALFILLVKAYIFTCACARKRAYVRPRVQTSWTFKACVDIPSNEMRLRGSRSTNGYRRHDNLPAYIRALLLIHNASARRNIGPRRCPTWRIRAYVYALMKSKIWIQL